MEAGAVTKLVVDCSGCGHVKIDAHQVTIRNCIDADDWAYWFVCPTCRARSAASANRRPRSKRCLPVQPGTHGPFPLK